MLEACVIWNVAPLGHVPCSATPASVGGLSPTVTVSPGTTFASHAVVTHATAAGRKPPASVEPTRIPNRPVSSLGPDTFTASGVTARIITSSTWRALKAPGPGDPTTLKSQDGLA